MKTIILSLALIGGSSILSSCCTMGTQDGVPYNDCGGVNKIVNVVLG